MNTDIFGKLNSWVPIEKTEVDIKIKLCKNSSPVIKRTQYRWILAWSCTVHKVQGLSLDKIVASLDLLKQRNFSYGEIYVALSRATSFNGLYIVGVFSGKVIMADPRVLQEHERMRLESYLSNEHVDDPQNQSLTVTLLNIRSISKHLIDLAYGERLRKNDVICLTET